MTLAMAGAELLEDEPPPPPAIAQSDTPPTPIEKAEAGFAETRAISDDSKLATLDVRG